MDLTEKTDEELMVLYQNDSEAAFNVLYKRHSGRVYGYLKRRVLNPEVSDDLLQATFVKLHRSRSQYKPDLAFAPWLFTIAHTVMLDQVKSNQVQSRYFKKLEPEEMEKRLENVEASSEDETEIDLSALPSNQRTAIEMRYKEDIPFEEIAKRLNTSEANVRQMVSRGVKHLRTLFGKTGV